MQMVVNGVRCGLRFFLFGSIAVALIWGIYADYAVSIARFFTEKPALSQSEAGAWGDTFGGFNALVSTVGAAIVIYTLVLQQRALKEQADDLHRQRFEGTFFELLRLMRELRGELRFVHSERYKKNVKNVNLNKIIVNKSYESLDAIDRALVEASFWIDEQPDIESLDRKIFGKIYTRSVFIKNESTFSPYFRIIYTILKKIQNDNFLSDEEKFSYSNMLRSQLTGRELYLLAFNGSAEVSKDMFDMIVHFRMLKYMVNSKARGWVEKVYPKLAFERRT